MSQKDPNILEFNSLNSAKQFYYFELTSGFILIFVFISNYFLTQKPNLQVSGVILVVGIGLILKSILSKPKFSDYKIQIAGLIVKEIKDGKEVEYKFSKLLKIEKTLFSANNDILKHNRHFVPKETIKLVGINENGETLEFTPSEPLNISKFIVSLKNKIPELEVDPKLSALIPLMYQNKVFGSVKKNSIQYYSLILLIVSFSCLIIAALVAILLPK